MSLLLTNGGKGASGEETAWGRAGAEGRSVRVEEATLKGERVILAAEGLWPSILALSEATPCTDSFKLYVCCMIVFPHWFGHTTAHDVCAGMDAARSDCHNGQEGVCSVIHKMRRVRCCHIRRIASRCQLKPMHHCCHTSQSVSEWNSPWQLALWIHPFLLTNCSALLVQYFPLNDIEKYILSYS